MSLYSWDYSRAGPADEWFRRAHAFADSAVVLFEAIEGGHLKFSFHHALAAAAMWEQGLELFLKGALVLRGQRPPTTHKLDGIYIRYRELYPNESCKFTGLIDDAVRSDPRMPAGQFLRYPVDTSGTPWPGNQHFDIAIWLPQVRTFRDDFRRLEPVLRERAA